MRGERRERGGKEMERGEIREVGKESKIRRGQRGGKENEKGREK